VFHPPTWSSSTPNFPFCAVLFNAPLRLRRYAREEKIDAQFTQSLDQIKIDDDVLEWIVSVMNSSTAESRKQRET